MKGYDVTMAIYGLRERDPRYQTAAYLFAHESLDHTIREMLKLPEGQRRHVSAVELLDGMRDCAIQRFGYMARSVWESWGVYSTSDWGNVIFNLIGAKLMQANEGDKLEDFEGVYDFESVFDRQWDFDLAYHAAKQRGQPG